MEAGAGRSRDPGPAADPALGPAGLRGSIIEHAFGSRVVVSWSSSRQGSVPGLGPEPTKEVSHPLRRVGTVNVSDSIEESRRHGT